MTSSARVKTFAAAVMLATAGSAQAAIIPPEGLFFSAWNGNPDAASSIVINLNQTTTAFKATSGVSQMLTGASQLVLDTWLDSLAPTGLGSLETVKWNVTGASLCGGAVPCDSPDPLYGGLTTSTDITTVSPFGWGEFTGLDAGVDNYNIFRNNFANPVLASVDAFFAPNANYIFSVAFNGGPGFNTLGPLSQSLPFYAFFADQDGNPFFEGDFSTFINASWLLDYVDGNASLTYNVIPIPAAVWLMGSALVALVGISRRKVGLKGDNDHEV